MSDQQLAAPNPFALTTLAEVEKMAGWIAESGCFGVKKPAQAITIMMIANSEKISFAQALKKYHVFETGQLSQRADYTQADFESRYTILWHARSPEMVAGTFFKSKTISDDARQRAKDRFKAQYALDQLQLYPAAERDRKKEAELIDRLADLSHEGEATIIRTLYDAEQKGITESAKGLKANWKIGSANMLQWRCVSDGVKLIDPSAYAFSMDSDLQDVKVIEDKTQQQLAERAYDPHSKDRASMQAIVDDYLKMADETSDTKLKQHYQGLAAEMRVKIAELDVEPKPVKTIETEVLDPEDNLPGIPDPDWRDYALQHIRKGTRLGDLTGEDIKVLYEKRGAPYINHAKYGTEAHWISRAYADLFPAES